MTSAAVFATLLLASATPCTAPEYRQFDFWAGSWDVRNAEGKVAGTNRIEPILGGCALQENWTGRGGMVGTSLNAYDPLDGRWHQTWVDSEGLRLELAGEYALGKMTLSGEGPEPDKPGGRVRHRITWSRLPEGGRVRQLWEVSKDAGASWKAVFDGTYLPLK